MQIMATTLVEDMEVVMVDMEEVTEATEVMVDTITEDMEVVLFVVN